MVNIGWIIVIAIFITGSLGIPIRPQKTLVLVDNIAFNETHSIFFDILKSHNHTVEYALYTDKISISTYGKYQYDNLIFFLPSGIKTYSGSIKPPSLIIKTILEFFDSPEKNIMIVADPAIYAFTRKLANEFGIDFDPQGSQILGNNIADNVLAESQLIFSKTSGVVYSGIGLRTDPSNNRAFSLLKADRSAFSLDENEVVVNDGPNITLVAGYQGLNNNRATVSGSTMMCSNKQIVSTMSNALPTSSANYIFCKELIEWNFGESGIIKAENVIHNKVNSANEINPNEYGIKTNVEYHIELYEWEKNIGKWIAFNDADIQLEFKMLDPYYRIPLTQVEKNEPNYSVTFVTPDKLGVFHFKINYTRKGYTSLDVTTKVIIYNPLDLLCRFQ